jgi:hypothetical protein
LHSRTHFPSELTSEDEDNSGYPSLGDLRIVRVVDGDGLCSVGWDVNELTAFNPHRVQTFNIYTCEFGSMLRPSQCLPRRVEDSACGMRNGPFNIQFSLEIPGAVERCASNIGDDDFDIVFGDYGYVVWCYNEDIKLPVAGSLSDETMQRAPAARPLPLNRRHMRDDV